MLAKAIQIASEAHLNQIDKGGKPYILHPLWVMDKVRHLGEDYMVVAVLHDVIEDTNWTLDNLRIVLSACDNYTDNIITALSLLTKVLEDQDYMNYIRNISFNPIAKEVKLRDLEHNTKITRLKGLRKKDFDRLEKYHRAYTYLLD